jgi:nucleoside-diphosphate-sugar epimerase
MHQHPRKLLRHVIIAGGAGFIGSQISSRLRRKWVAVLSTRVT